MIPLVTLNWEFVMSFIVETYCSTFYMVFFFKPFALIMMTIRYFVVSELFVLHFLLKKLFT